MDLQSLTTFMPKCLTEVAMSNSALLVEQDERWLAWFAVLEKLFSSAGALPVLPTKMKIWLNSTGTAAFYTPACNTNLPLYMAKIPIVSWNVRGLHSKEP